VTIYGISNCDTMKKARRWLADHRIAAIFHDYKTAGIDRKRLLAWSKQVGWETLFNRAGTTFRGLSEHDKARIDRDKAIALMIAHPSLIKRPVLEADGRILVGFRPGEYQAAFAAPTAIRENES
jgi:Spx/MgsR family transcriptional regulator